MRVQARLYGADVTFLVWDVAFGSQLQTIPTDIELLNALPQFDIPTQADQPVLFPTPDYTSAVKSMKVITHTLDSTVTSPMPRQTHWLISLTPSYRRARAHKDQLIRERLEDAKSRMLSLGEKAGEFTDVTSAIDHMVRREAQAAAKENRAPQYESPSAKDEMFGFLIAGHDTTATTLSKQPILTSFRENLSHLWSGASKNLSRWLPLKQAMATL